MKKILALALTALVLLSICSLSVADEKKTLTVWVPQYQFSKAEDAVSDADFWNGWFDAFEAENNCEVNVEILPWSDYNTTIYTGDGSCFDLHLDTNEIKWYSIEG